MDGAPTAGDVVVEATDSGAVVTGAVTVDVGAVSFVVAVRGFVVVVTGAGVVVTGTAVVVVAPGTSGALAVDGGLTRMYTVNVAANSATITQVERRTRVIRPPMPRSPRSGRRW